MKKNITAIIIILLISLVYLISCSQNQSSGTTGATTGNNTTTVAASSTQTTSTETNSSNESVKPEESVSNADLTSEPLPMRWILPGNARNDDEMVEEALYKSLLEDGLNIQPKFTYYGWDVWEQKTNVTLAAGDPFEMIHTMDNGSPSTTVLLSKRAIIPLNELLDKYGQTMRSMFSQDVWEQATINGDIMAIPAPWIDMKVENYFSMRQDKLDKYNIALPQTLDEILEACKIIAEGERDETGVEWYFNIRNTGNVGLFRPLQRGIDGWPFSIFDMMAVVYEDGSVASYLESPQFKQWCDFILKANSEGFIYPDLLSMDSGSVGDPTSRGNFLVNDRNFTGQERLRQQYDPEAVIINFILDESKPQIRFSVYPNCNTVLASSPNPESAVQFMDWLYSDQANMDLLILGIEGTHWIDEGERVYSVPEYNINGDSIRNEYQFAFWMTGWASYNRFDIMSDWKLSAEIEYTFDNSVGSFITSGFIFSPENVAAEYANCQSVISTYIIPIMLGFQDYDEGFTSALQRMNDAGLDKVLEEFNTQFEEFLATKK